MTLKLIVKNDGNQPGDTAVLRGVRIHKREGETFIDSTGRMGVALGVTETLALVQGEEVVVYPPCDHFDDFERLEIKGKH